MSATISRRLGVTGAALLLIVSILLLSVAGPAGAAGKPLSGGTTKITLVPGVAQLFMGVGLPIYVVPPGSWALTSNSLRLGFPVIGKTWNASTTRGQFTHKGGLFIVRPVGGVWHSVRFTNLTVNVDSAPDITAAVNNGLRKSVFDLNLGSATITYPHSGGIKWVKITNVAVAFSADGAAAFNAAFTTSLPAGYAFGTAAITAQYK